MSISLGGAESIVSTVVALINMKGGVGKTTLAVGLAWELAKDYRVLVVDIDPQFNATQWIVDTDTYLEWVKKRHTVLNVFQPGGASSFLSSQSSAPIQKPTARTAIIRVPYGKIHVDIVPSTLELMRLDAAPRGTENRLRVFLDKVKSNYDYVLIDCPPTASLFSYSAFLASDSYLIPVKPDPLSVLGLPLLEKAMKDYEERSGHELPRLGLVFTQVRQTPAMKGTMAQVRRDYPGEVFKDYMIQTTGVAEAVEDNKPLQSYTKTAALLRAPMASICSEFVDRLDDQ